jgi:hypothetical protein
MSTTDIKDVVKEKYGQAAIRVKSGGSVGSHPTGKVPPEAVRQLEGAHIPTEGSSQRSLG